MSEVDDQVIRQKRRRVDVGVPRSIHSQNKLHSTAMIMNGNVSLTSADTTEVLRKLLKHGQNPSDLEQTFAEKSHEGSSIMSHLLKAKMQAANQGNLDMMQHSPSSLPSDMMHEMDAKETESLHNNGQYNSERCCNGNQSPVYENTPDSAEAKRARVENILSTMRQSPLRQITEPSNTPPLESRRQKRKQSQPQQQRVLDERKQTRREERRKLKDLLYHLQQQLDMLQEKYFDLYEDDNSSLSDSSDDLDDIRESPIQVPNLSKSLQKLTAATQKSGKFTDALKQELTNVVSATVDSVLSQFKPHPPSVPDSQKPSKRKPVGMSSPVNNNNNHYNADRPSPPLHQQAPSKPLPRVHHDTLSEQMEAIPLIVPHRTRVRDTNVSAAASIRHRNESEYETPLPSSLPTSVAIPNPSLNQSMSMVMMHGAVPESRDVLEDMRFSSSPLMSHHAASMVQHGEPGSADTPHYEGLTVPMVKTDLGDSGYYHDGSTDLSIYNAANGTSLTSTLTPSHLKKAKLMFFYTRYPSSSILKQHFPDVKFNRHNTSQIIKWFSNFREFYYIQMEKFSRQYLSEGMESSDQIRMTNDSEIFRSLNLHYNKSNDFQVPESFLSVAQATLVEFFNAIKANKDAEPSWKKNIYKVISKLDEPLPEFFKSANCLDELE
ncbi:prospero homeobox protein 1-like isoform X2 [Anneissia japonica]|uniref:prospero homeobox protein 1-like isoform X2 n=1 Tax=Anneissia japonica TaxID=1529436 RepID=UPI0014258E34|nr:prospero homeobox protein 1-like isoform X2 [Anneissia japonica]